MARADVSMGPSMAISGNARDTRMAAGQNEWIRNRKAHSVAQPSPRVGPTQALAGAERAGAVNQRLAVKPSAAPSADAMRDSALLLNPPIGFTYQREHA